MRWPTGDRSVLSLAPGPSQRVRLIGSVLDEIRSRAISVPRYQLVVEADGGTVLVQERMPGDLPSRIDLPAMD